jgi:type I restriction enzyme S subunit
MVKLGEICEMGRGGSPRPIKSFLTTASNGVNWIKIGDSEVGSKYITSTREKIIPMGAKNSRMVYPGSFILSNSMSFGRPYIMKIEGCIHDGWLSLENIIDDVDQDYLYYALCSPLVKEQFKEGARGAIVNNLNIDIASKVTIPLPSLAEQKKMVTHIESKLAIVERAKTAAEKQLATAQELRGAYLRGVFDESGFEQVRLGDVLTKLTDGAHRTPVYTQTGVPFLSVKDMSSGAISFADTKFVSLETHEELSKRCDPEYGDILLTKVGTTGIPVLIDTHEPFSLFVSVALLKYDKEKCDGEYLVWALKSKSVQTQCNEKTQGNGNQNWVLQDIANTLVPIPALDKQKEAVVMLKVNAQKADVLCNHLQKQLNTINALPASIMREAFGGTD